MYELAAAEFSAWQKFDDVRMGVVGFGGERGLNQFEPYPLFDESNENRYVEEQHKLMICMYSVVLLSTPLKMKIIIFFRCVFIPPASKVFWLTLYIGITNHPVRLSVHLSFHISHKCNFSLMDEVILMKGL